MREALGLVETRGLASTILVADAMAKTANINIIGLENTRGLGYMTIKVSGDVGAVTAAVTCGKQLAIENSAFVSAKVIPRPSNSIEVTFCQPNNKNGDSNLKEEKELLNEEIAETENLENEEEKVVKKEEISDCNEELLAEKEEVSAEKEQVPINQDSSQQKVSNTEKNRPRKSNRKKVETKKIEE